MRLFVLGSNGMLGRYVSVYFKSLNYDVVDVTRKMLDATKATTTNFNSIIKGDVVINCIGVIKQRKKVSPLDFILVNSALPWVVANHCESVGAKLIHPSSDCVFLGVKGLYNEKDFHDAVDIYGRSKSLGEPDNCCVIRTSIIGEEKYNKKSLLEWVKSNKDKEVDGYTNHFWNGITCLQFAKVCATIINGNLYWNGVQHIYSPVVFSKFALVKLISEVYNLNVKVNPKATSIMCDRTLLSVSKNNIVIPPLEDQLIELRSLSETILS